MGKKWLKWLIAGLMLMIAGTIGTQTVQADDNVKAVPLSIIPVVNEHQATTETNYYDLEMKPGTQTLLVMRIANTGKSALPVKVSVADARTSTTAQISYASSTAANDSSLEHPLTSLLSIPEKYQHITIPAETTATYSFPLTMPSSTIKGIILGSINVDPDKKEATSAGVHSTYSYGVAVRLSNGVSALPTLAMQGVQLKHQGAENAVYTTLRNANPAMLRSGTLEGHVTKLGQNRELKSIQLNASSVAPNSHFTFKLPWNGTIAPGDYTMHVTYTSKDPAFADTKVWQFKKNFHVSAVEAARLSLASYAIPWWAYAILVVILLLLILIVWLLLKRRKEARPSEDA